MKVEVLVACDIDGTARAIGDVVDTTEETATALISEGKAKAVEAPAPAADPAPAPAADAPAPAPDEAAAKDAAPAAAPSADGAQLTAAPRVIAQTDLDTNPILVELAAAVGDSVAVAKPAA